MSSYPSFEALKKKGNQEELFKVHRSMRSAFSTLAMVVLTGIIVLFINVFFEGYLRFSALNASLPDIPLRLLACIPAYYALSILWAHLDVVYVFGAEGVKQHKGRLSLTKKVPYVKYSDVLALRVHMDPWGRLLDYGDIDLDTAASDGIEMVIDDIAAPEELAELLEKLRKHSLT